MGRHWRRPRWQFDFTVPLPPPQALPYLVLALLAIAALGVAALALLRTS
ncbi:hypothetical protein [Arthrobacter sp. Leaf337]|nr:hypothetical protein [Arthrobacter sp. Leaf337]